MNPAFPKDLAWAEFVTAFAAARLLTVMIVEFQDLHPDYLEGLLARLEPLQEEAESNADMDIPEDRDRTVSTLSGDDWDISLLEGAALYLRLFPAGRHDNPWRVANGHSLVAVYGALESFVDSLELRAPKESVYAALRRRLGARWHPATRSALRELAALRNIVVHNRGIVDEDYLLAHPGSPYQIGEHRSIEWKDVNRFCGAVWDSAALISAVA